MEKEISDDINSCQVASAKSLCAVAPVVLVLLSKSEETIGFVEFVDVAEHRSLSINLGFPRNSSSKYIENERKSVASSSSISFRVSE